jgi:hypothetical protein
MKFEGFNASESAEGRREKAERLTEERNGLFSEVIDRALNYGTYGTRDKLRETFQGAHEEMGETGRTIVNLAKRAPVLGHYINTWEGAAGVDLETGRELSSKESLVRNVVGTIGAALDVARMVKPGFTISGKTFEYVGQWADDSKKTDPDSVSSRALGAVRDFLDANKEVVQEFEEQLERSIDEQQYAK